MLGCSLGFAGIFTGNVTEIYRFFGLSWEDILTLLVISHGVITTCTCFFFEVPRIEELQDSDSSPRREEVGRRTLRDHGGFLLPFFCRDRSRLFSTLWE